jgi:serine/threonine protein phosphatase PrpC
MEVRAASVRGLLHMRLTEPRQDAFALACREESPGDPAMIAVVCDGVGSLSRSHQAAELVAATLAREVVEGRALSEAFTCANRAVQEHSDDDGKRTMATTAIALVLRASEEGWIGDVGWVGDSSCWHLGSDGAWRQLAGQGTAEDDGYHDTGSPALPSTSGECDTATVRIPGGAIFLLTDGVANALAWSEQVQATLLEWWASPPDAMTFACQVGFARKGHLDDRTAVGIWLTREGGEAGAG